jgi:hypothetical protein
MTTSPTRTAQVMDQETQTVTFEFTVTLTKPDSPQSTRTQDGSFEDSLEKAATLTPSISSSGDHRIGTRPRIPFLIIGVGILGLAVLVLIIYWLRASLKEN